MSDASTAERVKRDRSPSFPYVSLRDAIQKTESLFASSKGSAVRLTDAARVWELSPTSSTSLRLTAALLSFGLIEDEGSGDSRRIRVTSDAKRLIGDKRPGVEDSLLKRLALRPPMFQKYYQNWGNQRPDDLHAVSALRYDDNFTEEAAKKFLSVYDDTISYANLIDDVSRTENVEAPNEFDQSARNAEIVPDYGSKKASTEIVATRQSDSGGRSHHISSYDWLTVNIGSGEAISIRGNCEINSERLDKLIRILLVQREIIG